MDNVQKYKSCVSIYPTRRQNLEIRNEILKSYKNDIIRKEFF
jgi:hypothetical protein